MNRIYLNDVMSDFIAWVLQSALVIVFILAASSICALMISRSITQPLHQANL